MSKVLVTGGSGFIGSHLIRELLSQDHEVRNIDIQAPFLEEHEPYRLKVDLLDRDSVQGVLHDFRPDVIFNLAAIADIRKGKDAFKVNTVGLRNLLVGTAEFESKPRIIHTSTQLVAGPGYTITGPRDYLPYTEYGESKAESEEVLWDWNGDIEWTIIRPTTVWGPLYPTFAKSTWYYLYKRYYLVPNGHDAIRTYSYVGNLVSQLIAASAAKAAAVDHKTFYGGDASIPTSVWLDSFSRAFTGRPTRRLPYALLKALALLGDVTGKLGGPSPINSGRLYRMTADFGVPLQPTFDALGPLPYTLDEGVAATVEWLYEAHGDRYRRSAFNRATPAS